jgi:hypothetical protein
MALEIPAGGTAGFSVSDFRFQEDHLLFGIVRSGFWAG